MNTDSALYTGKTHPVCQDYVINGQKNDKLHYIFLADGCSSSNQTDVGARILCHTGKFYISFITALDDIKVDHENTINSSHIACGVIGIDAKCLDATLISAVGTPETVKVDVAGDGVIALRDREGLLRIISFEYDKNYPFYLNYKHPSYQDRYESWIAEKQIHSFEVCVLDSQAVIKTQDNPNLLFHSEDNNSTITIRPENTEISICPEYYDFVAIMSDGVKSFYETDATGKMATLDYLNVVHDILNFKNTNGEFVKRRLNKFRKKCEQDKIHHYDDISLGVINLQ